MANFDISSSNSKRLLISATQFVLVWFAEVYADALGKEVYLKRLA